LAHSADAVHPILAAQSLNGCPNAPLRSCTAFRKSSRDTVDTFLPRRSASMHSDVPDPTPSSIDFLSANVSLVYLFLFSMALSFPGRRHGKFYAPAAPSGEFSRRGCGRGVRIMAF
jgi:hypothetical protein